MEEYIPAFEFKLNINIDNQTQRFHKFGGGDKIYKVIEFRDEFMTQKYNFNSYFNS